MAEHWNSDSGTEEQLWWNSRTEMVPQWNNDGETVNRYGGTVEQRWWNSGTMMIEQWNGDGGTEEQR